MGAYGTPPKPDGFRFGSVNRPSPPRTIYSKMNPLKLQNLTNFKNGKTSN